MIAVISYTGYDLEDATCVSKMSRERGMMYGTIYKTKMIDLQDTAQSQVKSPTKILFYR
jgi:DNA-directed RNA polymerase I subunit RPA2